MESLVEPWRHTYRHKAAIRPVPSLAQVSNLKRPACELDLTTLDVSTTDLSLPKLQKGLDLLHAFVIKVAPHTEPSSREHQSVALKDIPSLEEPSKLDQAKSRDQQSQDRAAQDGYKIVSAPLTWGSFESRAAGEEVTEEVIPFDAHFDDKYNQWQGETTTGILEESFLDGCTRALLAGLESNLFQWDEKSGAFYQTEMDVRISGLSMQSTQDIFRQMISYGTNVKRLRTAARHIISHARSARATLIEVAIFVEQYTDQCCDLFSKQGLPVANDAVISLLHAARESTPVLEWLASLLKIEGPHTMADVMRLQSKYILDTLESACQFQTLRATELDVVRYTLKWRAFVPLMRTFDSITRLHGSITQDSEFIDELRPNAGVNQAIYDLKSIPQLISLDRLRKFHAITEGLAILRSFDIDDHTMSDLSAAHEDLHFSSFGHCLYIQRERDDEAYRAIEYHLPRACDTGPERHSKSAISRAVEDSILVMAKLESRQADKQIELDLDNVSTLHESHYLTTVRCLDRPLELRYAATNMAVLDLLLNKLKFREHLEVLEQVFFFGNGHFSSSLSRALFTDRTSTIRLYNPVRGSRWPPLAPKVAVATRDLLSSSFPEAKYWQKLRGSSTELDLLGHIGLVMSYEDEEQQLSRDSLDALQFLKFGFRVDAPLNSIITPRTLRQYSRINQFLLILLRMTATVDALTYKSREFRTLRRVSSTAERFRIESTTFIRSFVAHIFETAIAGPWRSFLAVLNRRDVSIEMLREAHAHTLDRISNACLVAPKLAAVQAVLRDLFTSILSFADLSDPALGHDSQHGEAEKEEERRERRVAELYTVFDSCARKFVRAAIGAESDKDATSYAYGLSGRFGMTDWWTR